MRKRDLTEIIGKHDGRAITRALNVNWEDWGRYERQEAAASTLAERRRCKAARLARLGIRYV
jgi:hypothetical protein